MKLTRVRLTRHHESFQPTLMRITFSVLLAVPFFWLASEGRLPAPAIGGYMFALALYWAIQAIAGYRRPSDGLLVLGLLSFLYVLLMPALVFAK